MRKKYIILLAILVLGALGGAYQWHINSIAKHPVRLPARKLEQSYAEFRAKYISKLHYNLKIDLTKKNFYEGSVKIDFTLLEPVEITLDYFSGELSQVSVNGKKVEKINYNKFFISIERDLLESGENTIEIAFKHDFGTTGTGLYRYIDALDNNTYLYSDFEPYDANAMFPCFDQPDLKGTFQSTVLAPKGWEVITSTREESRAPIGENEQWVFPESKRMSTYVYSLHAGPYKVWESQAQTRNHVIPLRLFARQSMAQFVDTEEWFSTTRQGLSFYEDYFDFPYPFKKYDQLIVPDFNSGAMENLAAVTFNESRYISRGVKLYSEKRRLAEVILHEMGHMWFGDLVTMKWWNDIWLNESFATYISNRALVAATPYVDAWEDFAVTDKRKAYTEDQLVTTHPIEFKVADTDVVFANFDGITYGKGAAVLKQLAFYVGEENFKKGMRDYFKLYAYYNTTLGEFINELSQSSKMGLEFWQKDWLQVPQVNTVKVDYTCDADGKVDKANLLQTAVKEYPTLRLHKTKLGIYTIDKERIIFLQEPVVMTYWSDFLAIPHMIGLDCSALSLIYPNVDDNDYVKVELDEKSLKTVKERIGSIAENSLRLGLWASLWSMVQDQKISVNEYLDIFLKNSGKEMNLDVLSETTKNVLIIVQNYLPDDEAWKIKRQKIVDQISAHVLKQTQKASVVDIQKLWFDVYVELAERPSDLKLLSSFLDKEPKWLSFKIDQDRRWDIIKTLNQRAYGNYKKIFDNEKAKDTSDMGVKAALATEASRPDLETKKAFWQQIAKGPTTEAPLGNLRPMIINIFPPEQKELQSQFREDFYRSLRELSEKPGEFLASFATMAPADCATESVNEVKDFAEKNKDLPPLVIKRLRVIAQEGERCVGIRAKAIESQLL